MGMKSLIKKIFNFGNENSVNEYSTVHDKNVATSPVTKSPVPPAYRSNDDDSSYQHFGI